MRTEQLSFTLLKPEMSVYQACRYGDIEAVSSFSKDDLSRISPTTGLCPIHEAIKGGHKEVVQLLIKNGVDINCRDSKGSTPLMIACEYGRYSIVQVLISDKRTNHNTSNSLGKRAFYIACENKHFSIADTLIRSFGTNIKIFCKKCKGDNILLLCRESESTFASVVDIIDCNVLPIYFNCESMNRSSISIRKRLKECSYLKDTDRILASIRGLSNESIRGPKGETIMHIACYYYRIEAIKVLLSNGVNVSVRDNKGLTPLHYAMTEQEIMCYEEVEYDNKSSMRDVIKLLLEGGASINETDNMSRTPLLHLIRNSDPRDDKNVRFVLDVPNIDVNITDKNGARPFLYVNLLEEAVAKKLIDLGAIPFLNDDDDYFVSVSKFKSLFLLELLQKNGHLNKVKFSDKGHSLLDHIIGDSYESEENIFPKVRFLVENKVRNIKLSKDGLTIKKIFRAKPGRDECLFKYAIGNILPIFTRIDGMNLSQFARKMESSKMIIDYLEFKISESKLH